MWLIKNNKKYEYKKILKSKQTKSELEHEGKICKLRPDK